VQVSLGGRSAADEGSRVNEQVRDTSAARAPWVLAGLLALGIALTARGATAEVAGRYKTQGQNIAVNIESWGEDCGPRPRSHSGSGGKVVEVAHVGTHLSVGGHRTDSCWSGNPRVKRVKTGVGTTRWITICETPADDARYEHGEYTIEQVDESTLRFREVSRYDWRLEGDHCKATVTLTRTYVRVVDEPATPTPPPVPETPPERPDRCSGPRGAPVKLEVRPSQARIEPGDRLCFRATARDADGCSVPADVAWARADAGDGSGGTVEADGCFVAGGTPGSVTLTATAGQLTARAQVDVRFPDIGDLVASSLAEGVDEGVEGTPAGEARPGAAQGVGLTTVGPVRGDRGVLWMIIGVGLGSAALLAVAATVLWSRRRRAAARRAERERGATGHTLAVASGAPLLAVTSRKVCPTCNQEYAGSVEFCPEDATKLVAAGRSSEGRQAQSLICPKCRRGFESSERFCSHCSEELVPYAAWRATQLEARRAREASHGGMICPKCAARYEQGIVFCQRDGTKLEPIN
jgi:hypothetical protein